MFLPLKSRPLSQDFCSSVGCVQELNREAGHLSHGASEETTGTDKRSSEICGRAGQSTQKGKEMENQGTSSQGLVSCGFFDATAEMGQNLVFTEENVTV